MLKVSSLDSIILSFVKIFEPAKLDAVQTELPKAVQRISAVPVTAAEPVPHYHRSSVDGYAVFSRDTIGASTSVPAVLSISGSILMGHSSDKKLIPGTAMEIPTGGELPEGADCVVMVEHTQLMGTGEVLIEKPASPGDNLMRTGEDIAANEQIIDQGELITPVTAGILASCGISLIKVKSRLRVAVFSTGDELIPYDQKPVSSQIRNVNSLLLNQLLKEAGCEVHDYGIIIDDETLLKKALIQALLENDLVLLSGGSSAGEKDLAVKVIESIDTSGVIYHGINIKPGKPTIVGKLDSKPVIGLPGNPGALYAVYYLLILPLLRYLYGVRKPAIRTGEGILECNIPSNHGREEIVPVKIDTSADPVTVTPFYIKSSSILSFSRSQAYLRIPGGCEGIRTGERVHFYYWDNAL